MPPELGGSESARNDIPDEFNAAAGNVALENMAKVDLPEGHQPTGVMTVEDFDRAIDERICEGLIKMPVGEQNIMRKNIAVRQEGGSEARRTQAREQAKEAKANKQREKAVAKTKSTTETQDTSIPAAETVTVEPTTALHTISEKIEPPIVEQEVVKPTIIEVTEEERQSVLGKVPEIVDSEEMYRVELEPIPQLIVESRSVEATSSVAETLSTEKVTSIETVEPVQTEVLEIVDAEVPSVNAEMSDEMDFAFEEQETLVEEAEIEPLVYESEVVEPEESQWLEIVQELHSLEVLTEGEPAIIASTIEVALEVRPPVTDVIETFIQESVPEGQQPVIQELFVEIEELVRQEVADLIQGVLIEAIDGQRVTEFAVEAAELSPEIEALIEQFAEQIQGIEPEEIRKLVFRLRVELTKQVLESVRQELGRGLLGMREDPGQLTLSTQSLSQSLLSLIGRVAVMRPQAVMITN